MNKVKSLKKLIFFLALLINFPFSLAQTNHKAPEEESIVKTIAWNSAKISLGIWLLVAGVSDAIIQWKIGDEGDDDYKASQVFFFAATLPTFIASISLIASGSKELNDLRVTKKQLNNLNDKPLYQLSPVK